ncbi:hypothetical protein DFP73DRAFT_595306 [Morchella snyderi]|nr:hypothetical protein DFP73DRAFT_595306 [Morchella snyderi]
MPPPDRAPTGKIVFVGNIPYGLTEEQITEIFSSAGRVLSFRLVYDRETGRPKGFGFAEYSDQETAASAVRNLDNHEIMGRKLRVDFSHEGNAPDDMDTMSMSMPGGPTPLPPLPPGVEMPAGLSAPDAISRTLSALSPPQLLEILGQMKSLIATEPQKAMELLRQAPQLSYAIFQALLLMNLVDTSVLTQVIENAAAPAPAVVPPPPPPAVAASATPVQVPVVPAVPPAQAYGGYHAPTPPQGYVPPPPPPPPQQAQDPAKAALIQQVLSLTPEQIGALPADQQSQIMMLKHQILAGGGF